MPPFFTEIMREIIAFKFDRENNNKIIVDSIEMNMRQMQKMRFNWKHFDEIIFFSLSIEHRFRKFSQFHEIQFFNYLKCRFHVYLNEMMWFMWNEFEIAVNDSTINKTLKRLNWNRKKIIKQIIQRCQTFRDDWMICFDDWIAEQLMFFDENAACERTNKSWNWFRFYFHWFD